VTRSVANTPRANTPHYVMHARENGPKRGSHLQNRRRILDRPRAIAETKNQLSTFVTCSLKGFHNGVRGLPIRFGIFPVFPASKTPRLCNFRRLQRPFKSRQKANSQAPQSMVVGLSVFDRRGIGLDGHSWWYSHQFPLAGICDVPRRPPHEPLLCSELPGNFLSARLCPNSNGRV
jgi:hypothetical protein